MAPPTVAIDNICRGLPGCGGCSGGINCSRYPAIGSSKTATGEKSTASPTAESLIWHISGNGEAQEMCGEVRKTVSCPNGCGIGSADRDGNKEAFQFITNSCNRPTCPVCYEQWAARLAKRVSERLIQSMNLYRSRGYGNLKHYIVSPPQEEAKELLQTIDGYKKLKANLRTLLKAEGYHGGVIIFHSHRTKNRVRFSPHFHIIGLGRINADSNQFYAQTGWIYKNKGNRKSVYHTVQYLLSHCGVLHDENIRIQHTSWFGELSYAKVVKDEEAMRNLARKLKDKEGIDSAEYKPHKKVVQVTHVARCPVCMSELMETDELTGNEGYHFRVKETALYRLKDGPPPINQEVIF